MNKFIDYHMLLDILSISSCLMHIPPAKCKCQMLYNHI